MPPRRLQTKDSSPYLPNLLYRSPVTRDAAVLADEYLGPRYGAWLLHEYCKDPKPTLRLYVDPQGRAVATLTRQPDGAVAWHGDPLLAAKRPEHYLQHLQSALESSMRRDAAAHLLKKRPTAFAELIGCPRESDMLDMLNTLRASAAAAAKQAVNASTTEGKRTESRRPRQLNDLRHALNHRIFDPITRQLCEQIFPHTRHFLNAYNLTAVNRKSIQKMLLQSPHTLTAYLLLAHPGETQFDYDNLEQTLRSPSYYRKTRFTPETAQRLVRAQLTDRPSEWKLFSRVGLNLKTRDFAPESPRDGLARHQLGLQALAAANVPEAPDELFRQLLSTLASKHNFFMEAESPWRHGDLNPRAAYIHLLHTALRAGSASKKSPWEIGRQTEAIADALRWHIEQQQTWGKTDWANYRKRSDRWHRVQLGERNRRELEELAQRRWTSLLPAQSIGEITAEPLTSGLELYRLGRELKNCLVTRKGPCENGACIIFRLSRDGKTLAAGELVRVPRKEWIVGEVETAGHKRRRPEGEVKETMQQLLQRYNLAQRELNKAGG